MNFKDILQKFKKPKKTYFKIGLFLVLGFFIFEFLVAVPEQGIKTIGLVPPQQLSILDRISKYLTASVSGSNIIVISGANELDSSRKIIADVYEKVENQDGIYITIPNGNYVRATFERELTNANDITLYAKGTGTVEVYKKNSAEKIMSFDITGENKYKQLLTNMSGTSDSFDLKSVGDISYDFITDPTGCSGSAPGACSTFDADLSTCSFWGCTPQSAGTCAGSVSCSSITNPSYCYTAQSGGCTLSCNSAGTNSCSTLYSNFGDCSDHYGTSTGCSDTCTGTADCHDYDGNMSSCIGGGGAGGCSGACETDGTNLCSDLFSATGGPGYGQCATYQIDSYHTPLSTGCTYTPGGCSGTAAACSVYSNVNNPGGCSQSGCTITGGPPYPCSGTPTACSGLAQSACGASGAGQGCTWSTESCTGTVTCGNFDGDISNCPALTGICAQMCNGTFSCPSWAGAYGIDSCTSSAFSTACTRGCSSGNVTCSNWGGGSIFDCPVDANVCGLNCGGSTFDCPTYQSNTSDCTSYSPPSVCTYYGSDACTGSVSATCAGFNQSTCESFPASDYCTYSSGVAVLNQKHFQIYSDTGSVLNDATALNSQDLNYNVALNTTFRIRFETANTGGVAADIVRRLEFSENGGAWTQITTNSNNVRLANSILFADGDATTTRLTATGIFMAGQGIMNQDSDTSSISLTNAYYTEDEYALKFETGAQGKIYQFRLVNYVNPNNVAYDVYTVIPTIFAGPVNVFDIKGAFHVKGVLHVK